jgi:hypothetical protein
MAGKLTISASPLTVKADDKVIEDDDYLPNFTSTITGYKNGDNKTIVCGPSYTLSPVYKKKPGIYTITPYGLQLKNPANYSVVYLTGTLYVNDDDGKNVQPKLDCVQKLSGDPSGFAYVANFSYYNPNSTAVYVPAGPNNYISGGKFSGQPPVLFQPGTGKFKIYFDGTKIIWSLTTNEYYQSNCLTAVASSYSTKCSGTTGTTGGGGLIEMQITGDTEETVLAPVASVYPNPASNTVTIQTGGGKITSANVQISDAYGRNYPALSKLISDRSLQVDLSRLASGMYYIRVLVDNKPVIFRVVKM